MTLGEKIFELRKSRGISQEELANSLNVTRQSISLWETNQTVPSLDNLMEISNLFNVTLDELCGCDNKSKSLNESKEIKTGFFSSGEIIYTKDIYERALKFSLRKAYICSGVILSALILIIFSIIKMFILVPFFIGVIVLALYIRFKKVVRINANNQVGCRPNAILRYWFFDDHFEINSKSDCSSSMYSKRYYELKNVFIDYKYLYLVFDGIIVPIDKESFSKNDYEKLLKLLGKIDKTSNNSTKNNPMIKILLLVFFILSIASIFLALISVALSLQTSKIPEFMFSMTEYMWIFYVFIPIPVSSIILGFMFLRRKYKCKKNIVAGIIMTFLLFVYGSFSTLEEIDHDFNYIIEVSAITKINFPKTGYFSRTKRNEIFSMVKFDNKKEIVTLIQSNTQWQTDQSFIPTNTIPVFYTTITSDYNYFLFYDVNCSKYNTFNESHSSHEYYYFAYNEGNNILVILNDKLS
ncbi:MAG: helix-turn-helix transcriptional regulator [Erysipelotrichales bacterium]|nr:helix-turn-helix transcriptional regulator [Erysipelotrichales bacterium]